jgi:hypothetical protein
MAFHPDFQKLLPTILGILKSDLDFFIEIDDSDLSAYDEEWWRILFALEDRNGRSIDLLTPSSLTNGYFMEELFETRERLL